MATLKSTITPGLLVASILLASCGDSASTALVTNPSIDPTPGGDTDNPANGTPDFSVVDLTVSNTFNSGVVAITSIANGGTTAAAPQDGWLLVSQTSGFTENYQEIPVRFTSSDATLGSVIEPGEVRQFSLASTYLDDEVYLKLFKSGEHYMKLWVNPDLGARFKNPEPQLMESHTVQEIDYTNNLSPEVTFDNGDTGRPDCVPDQYEENDSIEQATLIALDTVYDFLGCDDLTDVLSIDLVAGERYELRRIEKESSFGVWNITVIDPDGRYIIRNSTSDIEIFDSAISGPYIIVAAYGFAQIQGGISLEVTRR